MLIIPPPFPVEKSSQTFYQFISNIRLVGEWQYRITQSFIILEKIREYQQFNFCTNKVRLTFFISLLFVFISFRQEQISLMLKAPSLSK